jgi:uncharacterized HAD superfamily protein
MKKVIAVDLDGVLCEEGGWDVKDFLEREPIIENIEKVNKLFDQGHIIVIYTARREEDRYWTEAWLKEHGVKYDFLVLEKLRFDYYVDEKRKLMAIEEMSGNEHLG